MGQPAAWTKFSRDFPLNSRKNNFADLFHKCSHFVNFLRNDDLLSQVRDNQQPEQILHEISQNSRKNNFADFFTNVLQIIWDKTILWPPLSQVRDNQQPEQNVYEISQNSRENNSRIFFTNVRILWIFLRKDDLMAALAPCRYETTSRLNKTFTRFRKTLESIISRNYFTSVRTLLPGTGQPAAWTKVSRDFSKLQKE